MSAVSTKAAVPRLNPLAALFRGVGALPFLFLAAFLTFGVLQPRFLSADNLTNIAVQAACLVIVSMAQTLVLLAGGMDLSVGSATGLVSIATVSAMLAGGGSPGAAIALGLLAALATGALVGLLNGGIVALTRVSPFVITLGTMSVFQGLALMFTGGTPIFGMPKEFNQTFALHKLLGVPVPVLLAFLVVVATWVLLNWTKLGRYIHAVGANPNVAHVSGISVRNHLWLAYILAGLLVGLSAFLLTARVGSGEPNLGSNYPLMSIAAAVLGGVSLRGGEGSAVGAALGAVFITMIGNGMDLVNINSYTQMLVLGVILVLAVVLDQVRKTLR